MSVETLRRIGMADPMSLRFRRIYYTLFEKKKIAHFDTENSNSCRQNRNLYDVQRIKPIFLSVG